MNIDEKRTVCPYDCPDTCGMIVTTDGKKILSVRGDDRHPVTKGILCRKMQHYEQDIHSPHRILTPLKRVGKKGKKESFIPVSWEEAVLEICSRWKNLITEYGSDCILPYSYAGTMGTIQRNCGEAFFARLGAANLKRTICSDAKGAGITSVMGNFCDWHSSRIADADLILLWSSNPSVNRLHVVPMIQEARSKGAKVILVDVHRNQSAHLCDEVLLVKPGTDAALLLALMSELEKTGAVDTEFVKQHTTGYADLKEEFSQWTLKKAENITGVPTEQIRRLALLWAQAKKPMVIAGSGMSRYTNGAAAFRLLSCLPAITGAWKRGGGTSSLMGSGNFLNKNLIRRPDWIQAGTRTVNMNQLGEALLNAARPIRSLYVYHSNPAVMTPDQQKVLQGLAREDLFLVVHDRFLTDTALYADFVLPATFSVEQDDIFSSYGHYHMQVSWQVIPPAGESKSNWDVFRLLADGMGFEDDYFKPSARELVERFLDTEGKDSSQRLFQFDISREQIEQLRQGYAILIPQPDVLDIKTEDHKFHLAAKPPVYTPLTDQKYPLRLVMNHSVWSLNSNFSYRNELMEKRGPLALCISPADATERNIQSGELCFAYNDYGKITVQIKVSETIPQGTVIAEGVYQEAYTFGNGNFSSLLSPILTDDGEASTLNTQSVEICKKALFHASDI